MYFFNALKKKKLEKDQPEDEEVWFFAWSSTKLCQSEFVPTVPCFCSLPVFYETFSLAGTCGVGGGVWCGTVRWGWGLFDDRATIRPCCHHRKRSWWFSILTGSWQGLGPHQRRPGQKPRRLNPFAQKFVLAGERERERKKQSQPRTFCAAMSE